jgi:hypothetical protein
VTDQPLPPFRLRGERYAKGARPQVIEAIRRSREWSFREAKRFYATVVPELRANELALLGVNDRYFLATVLLRRPDLAQHEWHYHRCREVEAFPDGHLDLWFRGAGKSSLITFAGTIQDVLAEPESKIGIFSHTREIAKNFLIQIKTELEENEPLIRLYPDVLWQSPAERKAGARSWSEQDGIVVKRKGNPREPTVGAYGLIESMPTGFHVTHQNFDDVITETAVSNPEMTSKVTERIQLSFSLGVGEKTRRRFIGTRYSFADPYAVLLEEGTVQPRIYPATEDGTLTGKPVTFTESEWEEIKRSQRAVVAAQHLQNPLAGNEATFRTEWLRAYWLRPTLLNVYIMCDPSAGKGATSDRTAIAVIGVDVHGNFHFLDGVCHRMPLSERWTHLRDLHRKWERMPGVQLVEVGYEKYGMLSDLDYFEERMRLENYRFAIRELNWVGGERSGQSKLQRVGRLEPAFRLGSFFVPPRVIHHGAGNRDGVARWHLVEGSDEIHYRACPGLDREEQRAKSLGEVWRLLSPIKRIDEDGKVYDLTRVLFEEYALFPFSPRKDLIDAISRIYDMEPRAPVAFEQWEPEYYPD